jgi:hypothetical protein
LRIIDVDNEYHLWTIQDAKDGDVLSWDDSKCIALFKNIYDEESFNSYGLVGHCTGTFELRQSYHDIEGAHPATKEQRDLLFQKMKEAGYEWDAELKQLKKIEQKPAEWSEDDQSSYNEICNLIYDNYRAEDASRLITWLNDIKDRVQLQPKQEWSEEEIETCAREAEDNNCIILAKHIRQLKSLRPQSHWKPSDMELEVLRLAAEKDGTCLMGLYENLKKLR